MTYVSSEQEIDGANKRLKFIVYDLIDIEEYKAYRPKSGRISPVDRRSQLNRITPITSKFELSQSDNLIHLTQTIKFAPVIILESPTESQISSLMQDYLSMGYEGCMVKFCDSPYVDGRKEHWLKVKPQNEIEAVIIDVIEGDGKHQDMLGALLVVSEINGQRVVYKVGSGFTDEERQELWENKENLIAKVIDVQYQELTKENIPRFPVFVRLRTDKSEPNFE